LKILFTGKNHSQGLKEQDPSSLAGAAKTLGLEAVVSIEDEPDLVICVDYEKSALQWLRLARSKGIKTVLVANEPAVVIPQHGQARLAREFDIILKVGRPSLALMLRWPQTWLPISDKSERLNRVVLVNADKWSFVRGQHYWLRAAAASKIDTLDVFGFGWERSSAVRIAHRCYELWRTIAAGSLPSFRGCSVILGTPRTYLGSVSNKYIAMSNYKVALVVENSSELLTEKLFDAWFAGCIPVYLGPPVESFGIPEHLVVAIKEPTLRAVSDALDLALSLDREFFIQKAREFLDSEGAEAWNASTALKAVLEAATKDN
jgi:hypothetical protein